MAVRENRPITVFVINSPGVQKVAGGTTCSGSAVVRRATEVTTSPPPSPKTLRLEEFGIRVVGGLLLKEVVAHRGRTEAFF